MPTLYSFLIEHIDSYVAMTVCVALCIVVPYLLGSVNFALVISKVFYKDDIRKYGSGNAGTTNMMRTYGRAAGIVTFVLDILKGVTPFLSPVDLPDPGIKPGSPVL